jgi:prostatic aicd phosphatase
MSFELRQPLNSLGLENLFVRFGFRNGSDAGADLVTFPMFGRREIEADMPWTQFADVMTNQSITSQKDWCNTCISSNLTFCTAYTSTSGGDRT